MAKNKVISGDYQGCAVMQVLGLPFISLSIKDSVHLTKETVETYEVLDTSKSKSAISAAGRGLLGGFLLGPAGMLAGVVTTKTKETHIIAVQFKDGAKSLLEVDDKVYKTMMRSLF